MHRPEDKPNLRLLAYLLLVRTRPQKKNATDLSCAKLPARPQPLANRRQATFQAGVELRPRAACRKCQANAHGFIPGKTILVVWKRVRRSMYDAGWCRIGIFPTKQSGIPVRWCKHTIWKSGMAVAHLDPQSYKTLRTGWGGRAYFLLPPVAIANPQINKLTGQRPQMGIPKFPGLAAALGLFQFLLWPIKINPNRPASLQPDPHLR